MSIWHENTKGVNGEVNGWPFDNPEYVEGKCHLCDNPAVAFWHGRKPLLICQDCAEKLLPHLIVDALHSTFPMVMKTPGEWIPDFDQMQLAKLDMTKKIVDIRFGVYEGSNRGKKD